MIDIEKQISHLVYNQFPAVYKEQGSELIDFIIGYYQWLESSTQLLTINDPTNFNVGDIVTQGPAGGEILARSENSILVLSTRPPSTFENVSVNCDKTTNSSVYASGQSIAAAVFGSPVSSQLYSFGKQLLTSIPSNVVSQCVIDDSSMIYSFGDNLLLTADLSPVLVRKKSTIDFGSSVYTTRKYNRTTRKYFDKTIDVSGYTPLSSKAVQGVENFACIRFCDSLENIQSSSGGSTKVLAAQNCSPVLLARSLPEYADIDLTLEKFIVHFKQKYLANIEFDVATNKRLLIKNALSLYRAKGTERAVDLLFKLVYGTPARVYTPSDDLFKLSDGQYIRPIYLEVTNSTELVNTVGEIVTGVISGASGFVERYIRTRVNNRFVYLLYISAVEGSFINREPLSIRGKKQYNYPTVIGSLNEFDVINSGVGFSIGEIVTISSNTGSGGVARVAGVTRAGGFVDFQLIDGGWGYSVNADCIVSETVVTLSDVVVGNTVVSKNYTALNEEITQAKVTVNYNAATANVIPGESIYFANNTANTAGGKIINASACTSTTGIFTASITSGNLSNIQVSNKVFYSNGLLIANTFALTDSSASAKIIPVGNNIVISVNNIPANTNISIGDTISQGTANGIVQSVSRSAATANLSINIQSGKFAIGQTVSINSVVVGNLTNQFITAGLFNTTGVFSIGHQIKTSCTEIVGILSGSSTGSSAGFSVGSIGESETLLLNTDLLSANNTNNVPLMSVELNDPEYYFSKSPSANLSSVIYQALTFEDFNVGTIQSLSGINPGSDYNVNPVVVVNQQYLSGFDKKDFIINIENQSSAFASGEVIEQTNIPTPITIVGVGSSAGFIKGENVFQGIGTETANGIITQISPTSITIANVQGTFANTVNLLSRISSANVSVANVTIQSVDNIARGIVRSANSSTIIVKRIQFEDKWVLNTEVVGVNSGARANVVSIVQDTDSQSAGINAVIEGNVTAAAGAVTSLEIVDSGFGYVNQQIGSFVSSDQKRSGTARLILNGQGISAGVWRSNKGMLSSDKYLLDSDFYQDYSYQIISAIPFEKYKSMVLDVLHVAGTKLFSAVEIQSIGSLQAKIAESKISSI